MADFPDPASELRIMSLGTVPGANYWARSPVTRLDLSIGAFDEISSAAVPGFGDRLIEALPGLVEHRCSIGRRGGFVLRLQRGTYAPHIVEHVALELQTQAGHDVGYGRARGGASAGEYTVVIEHIHSVVGQQSAVLALQIVRDAFSGRPVGALESIEELRCAGSGHDPHPPPRQHVACGVIGGGGVSLVEKVARSEGATGSISVLRPARVLAEGLPYASSRIGVILDLDPDPSLPSFYAEASRRRRLYSTVAEGVLDGGWLVIPSDDDELARIARERRVRVATFLRPRPGTRGQLTPKQETTFATSSDPGPEAERGSSPGAVEAARRAGALVARILAAERGRQPVERTSDARKTIDHSSGALERSESSAKRSARGNVGPDRRRL